MYEEEINSNSKEIIFFDIDDTLIQTSEFLFYSIERALEEVINSGFDKADIKQLKEEYYELYSKNKTSNKHYEELFDKYFEDEESKNNFSEIANNIKQQITEKEFKNFRVNKLKDALKELSLRYTLGIITEGIKEDQIEKLKLLMISRFFENENIWITTSKSKEFYKKMYENYTNEKGFNKIWIVGDKEDKDIIPAKEVGFKTIRVSTGRHNHEIEKSKADYLVHSVADLMKMKLE